MNRSETIGQLAAALAAAQGKMKAASMNAQNPFFKSKYADLGAIIEAIRPVLAENGLSFTQTPFVDSGTVTLETTIMHASGEWLSSAMSVAIADEKGMSFVQAMGKAITYLRRYALASMFGVYADEDDDGNESVTKAASKLAGNGKQAQPEPPAPVEVADIRMTEGQRKRLHGLGTTAYGPDWDAKRHDLVRRVTNGRSESSADLTEDEAARLIRGIEAKLDASTVQVGEQPPAFPASADLHPESAHQHA